MMSSRGFSLLELLILVKIIFLLFIITVLATTIVEGNFWFKEEGVLKSLQIEHSNITKIVKYERNVWQYSKIEVEEGGGRKIYFLDTSILWNYKFYEAK